MILESIFFTQKSVWKKKKYKEARKYFSEKCTKEGDAYSMYKHGKMLLYGTSGNKNPEEGMHLLFFKCFTFFKLSGIY